MVHVLLAPAGIVRIRSEQINPEDISHEAFPHVSFPHVSFPRVSFPHVSFPQVSFPRESFRQISFPQVSFTQVSFTQISLPHVYLQKVPPPSARSPSSTMLALFIVRNIPRHQFLGCVDPPRPLPSPLKFQGLHPQCRIQENQKSTCSVFTQTCKCMSTCSAIAGVALLLL